MKPIRDQPLPHHDLNRPLRPGEEDKRRGAIIGHCYVCHRDGVGHMDTCDRRPICPVTETIGDYDATCSLPAGHGGLTHQDYVRGVTFMTHADYAEATRR